MNAITEMSVLIYTFVLCRFFLNFDALPVCQQYLRSMADTLQSVFESMGILGLGEITTAGAYNNNFILQRYYIALLHVEVNS